jgi:hypothetical protein
MIIAWLKVKVKKGYSIRKMIRKRQEEAMKIIMIILTAMMVEATPALASSDPETMGTSLLVLFFLGFGALIVVLQLIPSLLLFGSMLKGLFGGAGNHPLPKSGTRIP